MAEALMKMRQEELELAKRNNRLEEYEAEVSKKEEELALRAKLREEKRKLDAQRPKRLGPERYLLYPHLH